MVFHKNVANKVKTESLTGKSIHERVVSSIWEHTWLQDELQVNENCAFRLFYSVADECETNFLFSKLPHTVCSTVKLKHQEQERAYGGVIILNIPHGALTKYLYNLSECPLVSYIICQHDSFSVFPLPSLLVFCYVFSVPLLSVTGKFREHLSLDLPKPLIMVLSFNSMSVPSPHTLGRSLWG